ncbi:unnamed protein product, partial [Thlaspi arvense]
PTGCNVDLINYFGNDHNTAMLRPSKRGREAENITRQQKLQISLNFNASNDEVDRSASIPNQHPVSTGLRLSYDDDERNSSVTSASGIQKSLASLSSIARLHAASVSTKIQTEENLMKGLRDIRQRHVASFLTAIEKGITQKLREKDHEIENINHKNRELVERIKQVATEAQNWQYRAKYNESVVNVLKNNLQQAISQGAADQSKEGFGDSEVDDAASYIDPSNYLSLPLRPAKASIIFCRACKSKEVSILLMPCRHLCLCKDCDGLISVCPVCQQLKTASVQIFLS